MVPGVDSFYEYLVKGAALLQKPELMQMFKVGRAGILNIFFSCNPNAMSDLEQWFLY